MRLYIHIQENNEYLVKELHNITLMRGYLPSVGQQYDEDTTNTVSIAKESKDVFPSIEPAVWFKVNVIDILVIDCVKRCVKWQRVSDDFVEERVIRDTPAEYLPSFSMRCSSTEGCYTYEADLDELIEKCEKFMRLYNNGSIDNVQLNENVLQMLHFHVLPLLVLYSDDLESLEQLYEKQKSHIKQADNDMCTKRGKLSELQRSMNNQFEKYVQELQTDSTEVVYPSEFSKVLKEDICKAIRRAQEELNKFQTEIDLIEKRSLGETGSPRRSLVEKREMRNKAHLAYHNLLVAREHLREQLQGDDSNLHKIDLKDMKNPLHAIYIAMDEKRKEILEQTLDISQRKILLLSVKEAIFWAISEIKAENISFGTDNDGTGHRSTDVLPALSIPVDMKPLSEQLCELLTNQETIVYIQHHQIVRKIKDLCREITNKTTHENEATLNTSHKSRRDIEDVVILQTDKGINCCPGDKNKASDDSGNQINLLKTYIYNHFKRMCEDILEELNVHGDRAYNKLWLLYEAHFYKDVISDLLAVFRNIHIDTCSNLYEFIQNATIGDLGIIFNNADILEDKATANKDRNYLEPLETDLQESINYKTPKRSPSILRPICQSPSETNGNIRKSSCRDVVLVHPRRLTIISRNSCIDTNEPVKDLNISQEHTIEVQIKSQRSLLLKAEHKEMFHSPWSCLEEMKNKDSPNSKLQCLTKCLKTLAGMMVKEKSKESGLTDAMSADDLMDLLILLLCNCDFELFLSVYVDLMFLAEFSAPFLEGGPSNFSMVHFIGAYQFLQENFKNTAEPSDEDDLIIIECTHL